MDAPAIEANEFVALIRDSKVTTYAVIVSLALLLFDYFLTIEQEINFVWKSRFKWGKVLFLSLRYAGLFAHVFNCAVYVNNTAGPTFCLTALRFQTASSNIVLWLVEITLAIRVWLLYNRSKLVLVCLSGLYICSISTVIAISVTALFHKGVLPRPGPFLPGCYTKIPSYYSYLVLAPIITTTVLLTLTVYKTVQAMNAIPGFQQKPIMFTLLLRDGLLYFASVIVVLVINLLVFKFARPTMATVGSGFIVAVPYVAGSRSFLNVREKLLHPNISILETLSTFELRCPDGRSTERFEMDALRGCDHQSIQMSVTDVEPDSAVTLVASESISCA